MKRLLIISFISFLSISSFAQNYRQANTAETIVINKAVNVVVPIIDNFQNSDWQKEDGGADTPEDYSVQSFPDKPINVAPFNDWHFTVKSGSDFYDKNIKAYYDKMNNSSFDASDTKAIEKLQKEEKNIEAISNIYVEVHVNDIELPVKLLKNSIADLKIPGCYFSYKQPADKLIGTDHSIPDSYVLVFGNWSTATTRAGFGDYGFKFIHPKATPFLENIVIIISGNNDRILQLLKITDWQKINGGLTK